MALSFHCWLLLATAELAMSATFFIFLFLSCYFNCVSKLGYAGKAWQWAHGGTIHVLSSLSPDFSVPEFQHLVQIHWHPEI